MPNNKQIAADVLEAVGGKNNVTFVTHCMTRLRFNLKDRSVPKTDEVNKISGVLGVQETGGQYQVIIGQNVPKVYDEVCAQGGFAKQDAINENLDGEKQPLTLKGVGNRILDYLSGSMFPLIPAMIVAGLAKTLGVCLGPTMLNLIASDSDFAQLMDMVYNATFYFIPIYLGYTASKKANVTPVLGMVLGGLLINQSFAQLVTDQIPFTIFGISAPLVSYAQTVLPILLSIPVLGVLERFFKRVIPDALSVLLVPFLSIMLMLPVMFCLLGPIGSWLGNLLEIFVEAAQSTGLALPCMMVIGAFWSLCVVLGMHIAVIMVAVATMMQAGSDAFLLVATTVSGFATSGAALGALLRVRSRHTRSLLASTFIANFIGGVGEPFLYGFCFKYKRLFLGIFAGGALGALFAGLTQVHLYILGSANILGVLAFAGGGTENFVNGCIACAIVFFVTAAVSYFFGFTKKELADMEEQD